MQQDHCIRISNLSKKYSGTSSYALKDLNLDIVNGEIFGLLGPNGAGKTTFFSIVCGLMKASSGTAEIAGYSISKDLESIKRIVGVVPQDIALYPTLSGRDNLLFIGRMYGLKGKILKERVQECLSKFGFDKNSEMPVKTYSGGMKRRINLIGGILHEPSILLLDEPTVGMDVQTRTSMMEHLKDLNANKKMTILYTSHYLEQAELFCDRVAIMDQGKILCLGKPADLIKNENGNDLEDVFLKYTGRKIRD
ncbi:MAG: transporter ATP-binding protein [Bacteroidetes bacterium]|jgi:ABC-2 type transport system ATP-binding protein|nr:transporter ATP-binding protein [Bacteroidota bacterium]